VNAADALAFLTDHDLEHHVAAVVDEAPPIPAPVVTILTATRTIPATRTGTAVSSPTSVHLATGGRVDE
jgi:hypothetical protein